MKITASTLMRAMIALMATTAPMLSAASTLGSAARTEAIVIDSTVLEEQREILVRTPVAYDPNLSYSVVYVLDAEWNFDFVAAYLDNLSGNKAYPPLIVTGAINVNRNRDFVPRADPHFRHTGEADRFLDFVRNEWIAQIERRFSTSGHRVLVGHSFGGVFTLHTLFRQPELFDAYLAMGTSAWIGDRVLFEEARALFESGAEPEAFVWMAVGEGDGGPTVPSSRDLAALFELEAPPSLEWTFSVTPRTDHFTNFISGTHDAFMALFPAWGQSDELAARARMQGAEGVRSWFSEKEASLGWRFQPAWFDLGVTALGLSRDEATAEAARAVTAELRRYYPDNAYIALYSASVFENSGRLPQALAETERSISLVRAQGLDPNELQVSMLEAKHERISKRMAANEN